MRITQIVPNTIPNCSLGALRVNNCTASSMFNPLADRLNQPFLSIQVKRKFGNQTKISINSREDSICSQKPRIVTRKLQQTDTIEMRMGKIIGFLKNFTAFFNSSLKTKATIENGDISVYSFEYDGYCNC